MSTEGPSGVAEASAPGLPAPDIFISYRRIDAGWPATVLRDALVEHFGAEHVFIDVVDLLEGEDFVEELQRRVRGCDVFLALIGPQWGQIMQERNTKRIAEGEEDHVRVELETALQRPTVRILPVLLDDTPMPPAPILPHSVQSITRLNAATFRRTQGDADIRELIARIEAPSAAPEPRTSSPSPLLPPPPPSGPLQQHLREVVGHLRGGNVIPFLGPSINASERADAWQEGCDSLPDGEELASHLAAEFGYVQETPDLAQVSQYVRSTVGEPDLYEALRRVFTAHYLPNSMHRFLAELPDVLEASGSAACFQLIVTTNYDDALEQVFESAHKEYDLAVYMATGKDRGKFVHVPWNGEPVTVERPNKYSGFPIDVESLAVHRTVIVKVHGAVSKIVGGENYVITENDYIDYLSRTEIVSLVPSQLLNKMLKSHILFLGQRVRDWNLRVFLQRVWDGKLSAKSWAVDPGLDELEESFWHELGVHKVLDLPLQDYSNQLRAQLLAQEPSAGQ